jgi:hypothetical protein
MIRTKRKLNENVLLLTVKPVLRIRILLFLGLLDPDPDPLLGGTDPDPSIKEQNVFLSLKNYVNVLQNVVSRKTLKKIAFLTSWKVNDGSGSISHRHESADPDPYQYVTDPQYR